MELLTVTQAAAVLGVSDQTIRRYIARGVFVGVIQRGALMKRLSLIPADEVERVRKEGNFDLNAGSVVARYANA